MQSRREAKKPDCTHITLRAVYKQELCWIYNTDSLGGRRLKNRRIINSLLFYVLLATKSVLIDPSHARQSQRLPLTLSRLTTARVKKRFSQLSKILLLLLSLRKQWVCNCHISLKEKPISKMKNTVSLHSRYYIDIKVTYKASNQLRVPLTYVFRLISNVQSSQSIDKWKINLTNMLAIQ